jgi:uncharacterized membrane protein YfcA
MNWALTAASFGIGIVVGLTGMGGGALMTPVLVIFFHIQPLAAVSSDLVASAVMKPVGSAVHIRKGNAIWPLVGWLCVGSVPAAFCGVLVIKTLGKGNDLQNLVSIALGVALLLAVVGLIVRQYLTMREHAGHRTKTAAGEARTDTAGSPDEPFKVKRAITVLLGAVGGLIVGMTSVGSGSLIIVVLLLLYPALRRSTGRLVGTDLVQAVPLVASAALGHVLFGDFQLAVTGPLLLGAIPGVFIGAQISARSQSGFVRRALAVILLASALKLLKANNQQLLIGLLGAAILGPLAWAWLRSRVGLPAFASRERVPAPPAGSAPPAGAAPAVLSAPEEAEPVPIDAEPTPVAADST